MRKVRYRLPVRGWSMGGLVLSPCPLPEVVFYPLLAMPAARCALAARFRSMPRWGQL